MFQTFAIVFVLAMQQSIVVIDEREFPTYDECMVALAEKLNTPALVREHSRSEIQAMYGIGCIKTREPDTADSAS